MPEACVAHGIHERVSIAMSMGRHASPDEHVQGGEQGCDAVSLAVAQAFRPFPISENATPVVRNRSTIFVGCWAASELSEAKEFVSNIWRQIRHRHPHPVASRASWASAVGRRGKIFEVS